MYTSCKHAQEPELLAKPRALAYFSFKALVQGVASTYAQVLSLVNKTRTASLTQLGLCL